MRDVTGKNRQEKRTMLKVYTTAKDGPRLITIMIEREVSRARVKRGPRSGINQLPSTRGFENDERNGGETV